LSQGFIHIVRGDATALSHARPKDRKYLVHIVNDAGFWGKGFVLAVSRKWPFAKTAYRRHWHLCKLGSTQRISVGGHVVVVNVFAQHGLRGPKNPVPLRYGALRRALRELGSWMVRRDEACSVHMPRIGCGLAGGEWGKVEEIVKETLVEQGVKVWVYDL
jgi:O-acetyl-ADP-ribose deacetylase (regulator of RNase III)